MPHVWIRNEENAWSVLPLRVTPLDVGRFPPVALTGDLARTARPTDVIVLPVNSITGPETRWTLLWGRERKVAINGFPFNSGIRLLRDGDQLTIDSRATLFFSAETLARVETFRGTGRPIECPRCTRILKVNARVVTCPNCFVTHHEDAEHSLCWSYADTCSNCDFHTSLESGFRWSPEDL